MYIKAEIKPNTYVDSMSLMALSTKVNQLPLVQQAMIGMGTDMNKQVIDNVGLSTDAIRAAGKTDLILVVQAATEADAETVFAQIADLQAQSAQGGAEQSNRFHTLKQALQQQAAANLVVFSIPGEYVAAEAKQALGQDKHVMIFSDNVSVDEEIALKQLAHERGLLVMGPDCGTAIINGAGLCFANQVRRGPIGVVAASGTGSEELSVQVDAMGQGISQLIGVGGRDLSEAVGGMMMTDGFNMLLADDATKVIILLSKPPAASVQAKIIAQAKAATKPVVLCFIGADLSGTEGNITYARHSHEAARLAVQLAAGQAPADTSAATVANVVSQASANAAPWVRGLFAGGTICDEVFYTVKAVSNEVYSNVAGPETERIRFGQPAHHHAMIDFGDDDYTQGRPHPMIDATFRAQALVETAKDPEVGTILLDFELGYGANADPIGAMLPAIETAQRLAAEAKRPLNLIAYVLGTDADPQNKQRQQQRLQDAGVLLVDSAVNLGVAAAQLIQKIKE
ncbi:MAG: acyl-CoA synthetase FdrA [Neisseriaceae bacterium]|nr:acyl-CoA synthetase FdrA [Neisseriaceae bacterium]